MSQTCREGAGGGLYWLFVVFIAFGLALTSALVGGRLRFRWSWTDALVVGLMGLVAISAFHSLDRRPAINLAWEWVGLGLVYLLVRNLPRTQDESSTLAGVIVATAFAVSAYGLYQLDGRVTAHQGGVLCAIPCRSCKSWESSLAGAARNCSGTACWARPRSSRRLAWPIRWRVFIVGPLVIALAVAFQNLVRRDESKPRWVRTGHVGPASSWCFSSA